MHQELSEQPEPEVDQSVQRAPGGADADISESDVGAASEGRPVIPDPPFSAQREEDDIPDELTAPETSEPAAEEEEDEDEPSEPTA